jgi:hypothetical protein
MQTERFPFPGERGGQWLATGAGILATGMGPMQVSPGFGRPGEKDRCEERMDTSPPDPPAATSQCSILRLGQKQTMRSQDRSSGATGLSFPPAS